MCHEYADLRYLKREAEKRIEEYRPRVASRTSSG